MIIEQVTTLDTIEVLGDGSIQVRRATYFAVDGQRASAPQYHRVAYIRGADLSKEDPAVQRVAKVAWAEPEALKALDAELAKVPQIAMAPELEREARPKQ